MDLKEIMQKNNFAVVGHTKDSQKYAYKIKHGLLEHGYNVSSVGDELSSLNDISDEIDIIDLCINSKKGLELIRRCNKKFDCIVIQPGAESPELIGYLKENKIPFIEGCLLVGLRLYAK